MKKATRLLILTAFVLPLSLIGSAYAGGPGPVPVLRPYYSGSTHSGIRHSDPFRPSTITDGFQQPGANDNPLRLQDPIGGPGPDINRDELRDRSPYADHDPYAGAGPSRRGLERFRRPDSTHRRRHHAAAGCRHWSGDQEGKE